MHPSVRAVWHDFSTPLEGRVHSLYADVKGYLTAGVGNLADPVSLALKMPWRMPDGSLASSDEVSRQWHAVKAQADRLSKLHWKYAAPLTTIRLTDEGIDQVVEQKLAENEAFLVKRYFPEFPNWPADAQLAVLSMAWAVGPGFPDKFPTFTRGAKAGKWWEAAASCKIKEEGNVGVVPRNRANKLCFENAANVVAQGTDRAILHWPNKFVPPQVAHRAEPPSTIAEAVHAATESKFDLLQPNAREALGLGDANDESDEDTVPDLPSNRA